MIKKKTVFTLLSIGKFIRNLLYSSDTAYTLLFVPGFERTRWNIGKLKAWRAFDEAVRSVPAYKDYIKTHMKSSIKLQGLNPDLSVIPTIDKKSYIQKYTIEKRCIGGKLPTSGVVIDESSGTSGPPTNWVRGKEERADVKKILQFSLRHSLGKKPVFLLNAFALGPWATGMNVSMSLVDVTVLKSVGPDIQKIENTLNFFGPSYHYVVAGYPPFLKSLIDTARVDWKKYDIDAVFGGEGLSEGAREYLQQVFSKVYGSYGASDLEINIAAENDFTIALRKLFINNKNVAKAVLKEHTSIPMIFQYSPLDYYIETNTKGELIVTLCRLHNISPKIRYNIHDTGYVIRYPKLVELLASCNIDIASVHKQRVELPLLFHFGRSDMAVAFYGCKIAPSQIEQIIYSIPELVHKIASFSLITSEDKDLNKRLTLALEMVAGKEPLTKNFVKHEKKIFELLKEQSQDYREASKMIPTGKEPKVHFYKHGDGPFAVNDIRLKQHYIQTR